MVAFGSPQSIKGLSLPLVRCRAGTRTAVWFLGAGPLWASTHWIERQMICPGPECPACGLTPGRDFGYLGVAYGAEHSSLRVGILEVSLATFGRLDGLCRMEGRPVARGLGLELSRKFPKSPLVATPLLCEPPATLPAFDSSGLLSAVATLYRLPQPQILESAADWSQRVGPAALRMIEAAVLGL